MQLKVCRQEPRTLDKDGRALTGTFHGCYPVWYKTKRERLYLGEVLFTKVTSGGLASGGCRGCEEGSIHTGQSTLYFIFSIFFQLHGVGRQSFTKTWKLLWWRERGLKPRRQAPPPSAVRRCSSRHAALWAFQPALWQAGPQ